MCFPLLPIIPFPLCCIISLCKVANAILHVLFWLSNISNTFGIPESLMQLFLCHSTICSPVERVCCNVPHLVQSDALRRYRIIAQ